MNLHHRIWGATAIALTLATGTTIHTNHVQAQDRIAPSKTFEISITNLKRGRIAVKTDLS